VNDTLPRVADKELIDRLDHLIADVHDLSKRFQVVEDKIAGWESRAMPLLKIKEAAASVRKIGKGRLP
jgi:hypothetical protein